MVCSISCTSVYIPVWWYTESSSASFYPLPTSSIPIPFLSVPISSPLISSLPPVLPALVLSFPCVPSLFEITSDICSAFQVTGIFSWRHQLCRRQRPPPSPISIWEDLSSNFWDRSCWYAGMEQSIPSYLRQNITYGQFRRRLKTLRSAHRDCSL